MRSTTRIFVADPIAGGPPLFAASDTSVRFVQGKVGDSRLMAVLAPYADDEAAKAALIAAGGRLRP